MTKMTWTKKIKEKDLGYFNNLLWYITKQIIRHLIYTIIYMFMLAPRNPIVFYAYAIPSHKNITAINSP